MEVLYPRCCGLDVHQECVVACLSILESGQRRKEVREFATHTADLTTLGDWLVREKCTHVGMESTGVYWRPVYRKLSECMELFVVNAQPIKAVPGRKSDIRDAQWIADLLEHGLRREELCSTSGATRITRMHSITCTTGSGSSAVGQSSA